MKYRVTEHAADGSEAYAYEYNTLHMAQANVDLFHAWRKSHAPRYDDMYACINGKRIRRN